MKITNKTNFKWIELREVFVGDVFFFEDTDAWGDEPFVMIDDLSEVRCKECNHCGYYVLSLDSYEVWEPSADEKVRVVNSELIISNKED